MTKYEVFLDLNTIRFTVSAEDEDEAIETARQMALNGGIDLYDALKWAEANVEAVE